MAFTDSILVVVKASTGGAAQEFSKLEKAAQKSGTEINTLQKRSQLAGASIKQGLVAGATALVGVGLAGWAINAANAFVEAQDAAAQFARATNASVEEAGKFTTVARTLGLDMNDLIEINAEFSRKIQQQPGLLEDLNVQVAKNADGTTNMTQTLVATIDALGQMEDGLAAAQTAAQLFGEEGSKQLAGFYLAGIQVQDLMNRINFVNGSKEALKFKAASIELNLAWQQFQQTIGAKLVPVLTTATDVATGLVNAVGGIPAPLGAANAALIAGALAWSRWGDSTKQVIADVRQSIVTGMGKRLVDAPMIASPGSEYYKQSVGRMREYYDEVERLRQGHYERIRAQMLAEIPADRGTAEWDTARRRSAMLAYKESLKAVEDEARELADKAGFQFTRINSAFNKALDVESTVGPLQRTKTAFRDLGEEFVPFTDKVSNAGSKVAEFSRDTAQRVGSPLLNPIRKIGDAFGDVAGKIGNVAGSIGSSIAGVGGKIGTFADQFDDAGRVAGKAGTAFKEAGGLAVAAGSAAGGAAATGFRGMVSAVGGANIALIGLTVASVAYGAAAANAERRTAEFAAGMLALENAGQDSASALAQSAQSMLETSSYWERFVTILSNSPESLWQNPNIFGRAVQAAMEAFYSGERTLETYRTALEKAREEAGEYGVIAAATALQQANLNELLATGEYTSYQLADAVKKAADAQYEKNRVDERSKDLIEVQLDSTRNAVSATREMIDAQADYADAVDSYYDSLDKVVDAEKALKEARGKGNAREIAAAERELEAAHRDVAAAALDAADAYVEQQRQTDQLAGVYRDQAFYTNLAVAELEKLKAAAETPTEAAAIQSLIDQIRTAQTTAGEGVFVPLTVEEVGNVDAKVADLKARIKQALAERNYGLANALNEELMQVDPSLAQVAIEDALKAGNTAAAIDLANKYNAYAATVGLPSLTVEVDAETGAAELKVGGLTKDKTVSVNVTVDGVDGAKQQVEALAVPKQSTVTWSTEFTPGGYNAVKDRIDYLSREHEGSVVLDTSFEPGGYNAVKSRIDYLTLAKTARLVLNVDFEPGSYSDILARINTIARNRTNTITLNTVTTGGSGEGKGRSLLDQRMPVFPPMTTTYAPTNIFKIALEGTPLRAMIREEVAALQPAYQGVA